MTLVPLTTRAVPPGELGVRSVAEPRTAPLPRLADVVHAVTASFGTSGWTLRFGSSGHRSVVDRLSEADAAARRLVGTVLGLPPTALRVRITPDRATLTAVRRARSGGRPWTTPGPTGCEDPASCPPIRPSSRGDAPS